MGNSVMLNGIEYAGEQIAYKDSTYPSPQSNPCPSILPNQDYSIAEK